MKIKDLIKELGNYNPDLEVKAKGDDILGIKLTCDRDRKYYVDFNFQKRQPPICICDICRNANRDCNGTAIGCHAEETIGLLQRTFADNGTVIKCNNLVPEVTIE